MTDSRPDPATPIDPERLEAYLSGALPEDEAREVAALVASDSALARRVAEHRAVWQALGAYPDEPVPPGFAVRTVAAALREDAVDEVDATDATDASDASDASEEAGAGAPRASFALLRGRPRVAAVAAAVLLALGVGMAVGRVTAPKGGAAAPVALETIPDEVLAATDVDLLARLSDEDFEVLLAGNPEDLADAAQGG